MKEEFNLNAKINLLQLKFAFGTRFHNRQNEKAADSLGYSFSKLDVTQATSAIATLTMAGPWVSSDRGKPSGPYLDRRLLIGKALCVYWPHSWNQIPGTPIPFPLFPNIADMRLVR